MSWKSGWFGSENPSCGQIAGTCTTLGVIASVFLGLFVDFVPAPAFHGIHMEVLFLVVGIIETAALFAYASRKGRLSNLLEKGFLTFLFTWLVMPFVLGSVSWLVLTKTLPWAFTRTLGTSFRQDFVMETYYARSRRACDYRLRGALMERAFPRYICIREEFYRRHPEQRVSVVLTGKQSVFGTSIQHVYGSE